MDTTAGERSTGGTSVEAILDGFRSLGAPKLAAMGLVTFGMLCMLALLVLRGGASGGSDGGMSLLYGDLDMHEAATMADLLDKAHIAHGMNAADDAILVKSSDVAAARLLLAKSGLPSGGSVGYEIFDKTDGLTATEFQQDINRTRALEGELVRSIRLIDGVRNARVHLVLAHREPFAAEENAAQASVLIEMRGRERLDPEAVQAILNLVSAAVPGLKPQAIAIVDSRGDVLSRAGAPVEGSALASTADELRQSMELRLSRQVEEMLDASLGPDKVRAEAAVTLDVDQVNETDETFNPDQQVIRSQQTVTDKNQHREAEQNTSVANNLPNADAGRTPAGSQDERHEETDNYEIGKTVRTLVQSAPRLKRITLAVMVDGSAVAGAGGRPVWQPRSPTELAEITALVKSAIGFDAKRGDVVTVVSMPFSAPVLDAMQAEPRRLLGLDEADLTRIAQSGIIALVALAAVLFVFRPMVRRLVRPPEGDAVAVDATPRVGSDARAVAVMSSDGTPRLAAPGITGGRDEDGGSLEIEHVNGRVQAHAIRRLSQMVEQHPEESLSVMRGWLAEGAE